jgi:phospholipid/cholesterol/gamma-HCH transport system substrate-binding protein
METKANYTLIGLFTIAVAAAAFGFVYWFQHIGGGGERAVYRVMFQSPVSGLRTGSAVLFNGIRIGEVKSLSLRPDNPNQVAAVISVDKTVQLRPDTRVGVEFQGLTGIAAVALAGGSPGEPPLKSDPQNPATLFASPASTQDVTQGAREVLQRIDDFIEENRNAFRSTLSNLDTFTEALAQNSQRIDNILSGVESLTGGSDGKGGDLNAAARSIRDLADKLNGQTADKLNATLDSMRNLTDNLDKRTQTITKGINELTETGSKQINAVSRDLQKTLGTIDRTVNNIDKNPSRLLFGGSSSK